MSPNVMKKWLHPVWEKVQKVDGTFGISVSEKELKKETEEDLADGYEDEIQDEDLAEKNY